MSDIVNLKIPHWKLSLNRNLTSKKAGLYLIVVVLFITIAKLIAFSFIYGIEMLLFFHPVSLILQFLFIIGLAIFVEYWLFGKLARIKLSALEFQKIIKNRKVNLNGKVYQVKEIEIKEGTIKNSKVKGKLVIENNFNINFSSPQKNFLKDKKSYTLTKTDIEKELRKIFRISALLFLLVFIGIYIFVSK